MKSIKILVYIIHLLLEIFILDKYTNYILNPTSVFFYCIIFGTQYLFTQLNKTNFALKFYVIIQDLLIGLPLTNYYYDKSFIPSEQYHYFIVYMITIISFILTDEKIEYKYNNSLISIITDFIHKVVYTYSYYNYFKSIHSINKIESINMNIIKDIVKDYIIDIIIFFNFFITISIIKYTINNKTKYLKNIYYKLKTLALITIIYYIFNSTIIMNILYKYIYYLPYPHNNIIYNTIPDTDKLIRIGIMTILYLI